MLQEHLGEEGGGWGKPPREKEDFPELFS